MEAETLQVAVDVGCRRHHAAIATAQGRVLAEFDVEHTPAGFEDFFGRIGAQRDGPQPVCVAMEGYNGYARPLDQQVRARGYRLLNVNSRCARYASDAGAVAGASSRALGQAHRAGSQ